MEKQWDQSGILRTRARLYLPVALCPCLSLHLPSPSRPDHVMPVRRTCHGKIKKKTHSHVFWDQQPKSQDAFKKQGQIQNLHCRGRKWPNIVERFTLARSAERGRDGEGIPLPAGGGSGSPPGMLWKIASNWFILSAFWGNQNTF